MASTSLKLRALVLGYVFIAVLFHPLLSQAAMAASSDTTSKSINIDRKALDQGVAYVLMLVALLVTYLLH